MDVSNKSAIRKAATFQSSSIGRNGIRKMVAADSYLYILTGDNPSKKILVFSIANPTSLVHASSFTADIIDFDVSDD
ncbi:MAG: hypothetical protein ACUVWA_14365 [Candidatus Oleimicrobiaceae bacterium]